MSQNSYHFVHHLSIVFSVDRFSVFQPLWRVNTALDRINYCCIVCYNHICNSCCLTCKCLYLINYLFLKGVMEHCYQLLRLCSISDRLMSE